MKYSDYRFEMVRTLVIPCPSCSKVYTVYGDDHIDEYLSVTVPLSCEGCGESILCVQENNLN